MSSIKYEGALLTWFRFVSVGVCTRTHTHACTSVFAFVGCPHSGSFNWSTQLLRDTALRTNLDGLIRGMWHKSLGFRCWWYLSLFSDCGVVLSWLVVVCWVRLLYYLTLLLSSTYLLVMTSWYDRQFLEFKDHCCINTFEWTLQILNGDKPQQSVHIRHVTLTVCLRDILLCILTIMEMYL